MKEIAPAKLTLTLRMLDKREDGFNNLEALTVFLPEVFDILNLNMSGDFEVKSESIAMSADDTNLVVRAFQLFSSHSKVVGRNLDIGNCGFVLEKHIPIAAGLGGGSADAAATLRLLNRKFGSILNEDELHEMAAWLGSDIPGCLRSKALWMEGRGDVIKEISDFDAVGMKVLVVTPNIFCPTPLVYKRFEQMGRPSDEGMQVEGLAPYADNLHNDLSIAAFDLFPNLLEFKENIESISKLDFFLAGSGSSLFAVSETESIQKAQSAIEAEFSRDDYRMIGSSSMA